MAKKYIFRYTSYTLGIMGKDTVWRNEESFRNIAELRAYANDVPRYGNQRMGGYIGYIYDMKTGAIVGAIDRDRYVYKQNGKLYCRFMNKGGALDSYYGKMKYDGDLKF